MNISLCGRLGVQGSGVGEAGPSEPLSWVCGHCCLPVSSQGHVPMHVCVPISYFSRTPVLLDQGPP